MQYTLAAQDSRCCRSMERPSSCRRLEWADDDDGEKKELKRKAKWEEKEKGEEEEQYKNKQTVKISYYSLNIITTHV